RTAFWIILSSVVRRSNRGDDYPDEAGLPVRLVARRRSSSDFAALIDPLIKALKTERALGAILSALPVNSPLVYDVFERWNKARDVRHVCLSKYCKKAPAILKAIDPAALAEQEQTIEAERIASDQDWQAHMKEYDQHRQLRWLPRALLRLDRFGCNKICMTIADPSSPDFDPGPWRDQLEQMLQAVDLDGMSSEYIIKLTAMADRKRQSYIDPFVKEDCKKDMVRMTNVLRFRVGAFDLFANRYPIIAENIDCWRREMEGQAPGSDGPAPSGP
ncbi:MAG: hypothetical protein U9N14_05875, partial [Pseudomonadota bacterium]|nr:hypothetical protein [Pseudomonadota bacterium]